MNRTLIYDTETTGLIPNSVVDLRHQSHIIEFYGCVVDEGGNVIEELEFLCDPGIPLEPVITRITGLTDKDLTTARPFKDYAIAVKDLIERCDSVVAHNLSFDEAMVGIEMRRCGVVVEWPLFRICTVEESEWYRGYRLSLTALHTHLFGEEFKDAHRARHDVEALTRCFVEMRKRGDL
ncbi:MAG: 3'-5' exonuclease [Gammaproteobacteria bacterium]